MSKVRLTHRPTRDPKDEQPSRNEVDTVAAALALTYELSKGRGFKVGIEIRQNDKVLYDESTLSRAVDRIGTLIGIDGLALDEAAEEVAKEDGLFN